MTIYQQKFQDVKSQIEGKSFTELEVMWQKTIENLDETEMIKICAIYVALMMNRPKNV